MWLLLAMAVVVLSAVACGGGEEPSGSPTPAATVEDAALAPCQALDRLERYRYTSLFRMESPEPSGETPPVPRETPLRPMLPRDWGGDFLFEYKMDASFVAPDRTEVVIDAGTGVETVIIAIGSDIWTSLGDGWSMADTSIPPYRPDIACYAMLPQLDLSSVQPAAEKVDGVDALHYSFSEVPAGDSMKNIFGSGSDIHVVVQKLNVDVWLEEKDSWPARIEIRGSGYYSDGRELHVELVTDVTDANSKNIKVEPPI
jgi:hypothetical protein